ncbi:MAG: ankyrin repeat domain-containing protein [Candidatus Brocadiae bacterium]|nr:ankyrin repeat domain-containing protein [Candidatus Brocadiia bacterium]
MYRKALMFLSAVLMLLCSGCSNSLHRAAIRGHVDVVDVLLDSGADPYPGDKAGQPEVLPVDAWVGLMAIMPSPKGDLVALTLDHWDPDLTSPLLVITKSGELQISTAQSPPTVHTDIPLGWFPDGTRLLFSRRVRRAAGSGDTLTEVLVLSLEDGRTESLSGGKGGLSGWTTVVDESTCIGRVSGKAFDSSGLYLFQRSDEEWRANLLLADSEERQWKRCLWARRQEDTYRMVAEAKDKRGGFASYWSVEFADGMEPRSELIATFDGWVGGVDVSPDGGVLAVIRSGDAAYLARVVLLPVRRDGGHIRNVSCGSMVHLLSFSPKGEQLVLWNLGWLGGGKFKEGLRAEVLTMNLASEQILEVYLPAELQRLEFLEYVEWLSETSIAVGFVNYGTVVLDLTTGKAKTLWRIPSDK